MSKNWGKLSVASHKRTKGKLTTALKLPLKTKHDLSIAYTPGVAQVCLEIRKTPNAIYDLTWVGSCVAVITNGTRVLGLGDIGPKAAMPVMEGKAVLFKGFANVDSIPICVNEKNPDKFIEIVKAIAPSFGGINLEDIRSPDCFYIEDRLKQELDIPVFHDDQHGTAIVALAAVINACKATKRDIKTSRFVIDGVGAAGASILKLLHLSGARDIIAIDSKGTLSRTRKELFGTYKESLLPLINEIGVVQLEDAIEGADVYIGTSQAGRLRSQQVQSMNEKPIVIALSNPTPEIMPDVALKAGAAIVCTGRSDFPNQVNNVLAFPGIFKGAFDAKATKITQEMKIAAAHAIASLVSLNEIKKGIVVPSPFDKRVAKKVSSDVAKMAKKQKITRIS